MRYIIITFVVFCFACEEHDINPCCSMNLVFSDALPVQIWINGVQSFNQKAIYGTNHRCFLAPIQCDDTITLQFRDLDDDGLTYELGVYNDTGTLVKRLAITEIISGVYGLTFVPSTEFIACNAKYIFKVQAAPAISITNSGQVSGWSNTGTGDQDWYVGSYVTKSTQFRNSTISPSIANATSITVKINVTGFGINRHLYAILSQSSGGSTQTVDFGTSISLGINSVTVTTTAIFDRISLYIEGSGASFNDTTITEVQITSFTLVSLTNPSFVSTLSPWTSVAGPDQDWSHDGTNDAAQVTLAAPPNEYSDYLSQDLPATIPVGTTIKCDVNWRGALGSPGTFWLYGYDGSNGTIEAKSISPDGTTQALTFNGVAPGNITKIRFACTLPSSGNFKLYDVALYAGTDYTITNGAFGSAGTWTNVGAGYPWIITSGEAYLQLANSAKLGTKFFDNSITKRMKKTISLVDGHVITYAFGFLASTDEATAIQIDVTVTLRKAGAVIHTFTKSVTTESIETLSGTVTLDDDIDEVSIVADNNGTAQVVDFSMNSMSILDNNLIYAYTDQLDLRTTHAGTELLAYTNDIDFAEIKYTGLTAPQFFMRVKSRLFEEQFPEEIESDELSDGEIVVLVDSIKSQQQFEVDFAPFYFHKKVKLALAHKTVEIQDQLWKKEGTYDLAAINKQTKLRTGKTWLSKKNDTQRNV